VINQRGFVASGAISASREKHGLRF